MPISIKCPGCQRPYQVQDQMAGQAVKCACGSQFVIPRSRVAVPAPAAQDDWLGQELLTHQQKQAEAAASREQANNPYAPPGMASMHGMNQYAAPSMGGLWREGQFLVMDRNAQLPNICVKSGQPATRFLTRSPLWQPPWLQWMGAIATLTGPIIWLIYAILSVIFTKRATVHIGLSEEWFKRRLMFQLIGWIGSLAGIAIPIVTIAIAGDAKGQAAIIPFGLFIAGVILVAVCWPTGYFGSRMVWADLITDRHVWVGGVCETFLQPLPRWTGGRPK